MAGEKDPWEVDEPVNPEFEKRFAAEDYGPLYTGVRRFNQTLPFIGSWLPRAEAKGHQLLKEYGIEKPEEGNTFEKELEYQRFLDKKLSQENPLSSAVGTGAGVLSNIFAGTNLLKGAEKLPFLTRLALGSGAAGVEAGLDDPSFYKEGSNDWVDPEQRLNQAKNAAAFSALVGTGGEGLQKMFGGKKASNRAAWKVMEPSNPQTAKVQRNIKGGTERVGEVLKDEGILKGLPNKDEILSRIEPKANKYEKSLRDSEKELEKNLNAMQKKVLNREPKKGDYGVSRDKIAERIHEQIADDLDIDVATPEERRRIFDKLDEFKRGSPLDVETLAKKRARVQARTTHADTTKTQLDKKYDEAKARAMNEALDDLMHRFVGKKQGEKYKLDREKLSSLIASKEAAKRGQIKELTKGTDVSLKNIFTSSLLGGPKAQNSISKILGADLAGTNVPQGVMSLSNLMNLDVNGQSQVEKDPWEE